MDIAWINMPWLSVDLNDGYIMRDMREHKHMVEAEAGGK